MIRRWKKVDEAVMNTTLSHFNPSTKLWFLRGMMLISWPQQNTSNPLPDKFLICYHYPCFSVIVGPGGGLGCFYSNRWEFPLIKINNKLHRNMAKQMPLILNFSVTKTFIISITFFYNSKIHVFELWKLEFRCSRATVVSSLETI